MVPPSRVHHDVLAQYYRAVDRIGRPQCATGGHQGRARGKISSKGFGSRVPNRGSFSGPDVGTSRVQRTRVFSLFSVRDVLRGAERATLRPGAYACAWVSSRGNDVTRPRRSVARGSCASKISART